MSARPNFYTIWRKFGGREEAVEGVSETRFPPVWRIFGGKEEAMGVVKPNFSPQSGGYFKEGSSGGLLDQISFSTDWRKFSGRKEAANGVGGDGHNRCCHSIIIR